MECWRESRGLPRCEDEAVLLDTANILQQHEHDCGVAAAEIVARLLRVSWPDDAGKWADRVQGMAPDTLAQLVRSLGLHVLAGEMVGGVADLQHHTRNGRPVVCDITTDAGGHWVVVRGVERRKVHVQCPTNGRIAYPLAEWLDRWRDVSGDGLRNYERWGIVAARE